MPYRIKSSKGSIALFDTQKEARESMKNLRITGLSVGPISAREYKNSKRDPRSRNIRWDWE